mmetsp:Transcript_26718/g.48315  ORF Transcript_26718/g.48315 Transcript_26718/m.48315 type:complete len:90 (-) Transcript_26718:177-446(-)
MRPATCETSCKKTCFVFAKRKFADTWKTDPRGYAPGTIRLKNRRRSAKLCLVIRVPDQARKYLSALVEATYSACTGCMSAEMSLPFNPM